MNKKQDEQQIDSNYERWWDETVHYKTKEKWKPAVEDLFDFHNIPVIHEKFSLDFVMRVIKFVARYDERWKKFPPSSFDAEKYNAHKSMYSTVEDELNRLVDEHDEKKKQL